MIASGHRPKWAYFVLPHSGGTFTVYKTLRAGLAAAGIELRWVGTGAAAHQAFNDPAWIDERGHGDAVGSATSSDHQENALALARAVESGGYDGVFINVLTSLEEMNAARLMRPDLLRVMIVHSITPGTYAAARALRDHVHATVGVSPRVCDDLVRWHGFARDRCTPIPNAIDVPTIPDLPLRPLSSDRLRLIYLGRVEDGAKGVFWLPRIVARLAPSVTLTIAGDGPDLAALRQRCVDLGERVRFIGAVPADEVPGLLAQHDAVIAPSRFEGLPCTLLEAMASGCVPVASRIKGVTDTIIKHGHSGMLFQIGDVNGAVMAIRQLEDASLVRKMSAAAASTARERFTVARMAAGYLHVMESIRAAPPPVALPLDPRNPSMPSGFRPGLRTYLPAPLKNVLRTMRERWAT